MTGPNTHTTEEAHGGQGAHMSRTDMQLLRSAIARGYDIPPDELKSTPDVLLKIVSDGSAARRDRIAAAKTLASLRRLAVEQYTALLRGVEAGDDVDREAVTMPDWWFDDEDIQAEDTDPTGCYVACPMA